MAEALLLALKFTLLGNAIFMLLWMDYRILAHHSLPWITLDAAIVVCSVMVAHRFREEFD